MQELFFSSTSSPCLLVASLSSSRRSPPVNILALEDAPLLGSLFHYFRCVCMWCKGEIYNEECPLSSGCWIRHNDHRVLARHLLLHHHRLDAVLSDRHAVQCAWAALETLRSVSLSLDSISVSEDYLWGKRALGKIRIYVECLIEFNVY